MSEHVMRTHATYELTEAAVLRISPENTKIALAIKENTLTFKVRMDTDAALRLLRDLVRTLPVLDLPFEDARDLRDELERYASRYQLLTDAE